MSHGSENEEEEGNPYVQCCHLPPSDDKKVLWIQWVIYQLIDQAKAALPVVTFVFFFMLIILGQTPSDVMELSYGMLFVIVGLVFFMYVAHFLQCVFVTLWQVRPRVWRYAHGRQDRHAAAHQSALGRHVCAAE